MVCMVCAFNNWVENRLVRSIIGFKIDLHWVRVGLVFALINWSRHSLVGHVSGSPETVSFSALGAPLDSKIFHHQNRNPYLKLFTIPESNIFLWLRTTKLDTLEARPPFSFMFAVEMDCVPSVSRTGALSGYSHTRGVLSDYSTGRAGRYACSQGSSIRKHFGQVFWKFARAFAGLLSSNSPIEQLSNTLHRTASVIPDSGISR
jgi:hypothetical protein